MEPNKIDRVRRLHQQLLYSIGAAAMQRKDGRGGGLCYYPNLVVNFISQVLLVGLLVLGAFQKWGRLAGNCAMRRRRRRRRRSGKKGG